MLFLVSWCRGPVGLCSTAGKACSACTGGAPDLPRSWRIVITTERKLQPEFMSSAPDGERVHGPTSVLKQLRWLSSRGPGAISLCCFSIAGEPLMMYATAGEVLSTCLATGMVLESSAVGAWDTQRKTELPTRGTVPQHYLFMHRLHASAPIAGNLRKESGKKAPGAGPLTLPPAP